MKLYIYDNNGRRKKGVVDGDGIESMAIDLTIDDYAALEFTITDPTVESGTLSAFDLVHVEEDGNILFAGPVINFNITAKSETIKGYDYRWILSKILLDEPLIIKESDDFLDVFEDLLEKARSKRDIPIELDREESMLNPDFNTDLKFEVGDNIASVMKKIIEDIYARWAIRYEVKGDRIKANLVIRSVMGITPAGIGIARAKQISEDGTVIELIYSEGSQKNNIVDFNFKSDVTNFSSDIKVAYKIDGNTKYLDVPPQNFETRLFKSFFGGGKFEKFVTDYKVNSQKAAKNVGGINQSVFRQDATIEVSPDFEKHLRPGDRVSLTIDSPFLNGINENGVRVDAVNYDWKDGYFKREFVVNTLSPQKKVGNLGVLLELSNTQGSLDGLDKNYLSN